MLSQDAVVRLNQELVGEKVLSVYLNAEETDPAAKRAWRVRLGGMLKALEEELSTAPADERRAAHAAAEHIRDELERFDGMLPERGWVGFATAERLRYAESSPAPMPDLLRWEDGAHVAPYVRALKQARPMTAIVADRRRARIFRYLHGELREGEVIWSEPMAAVEHPSSSKRASTHSGTRGESHADAAQRGDDASTRRLLRAILDAVSGPVSDGHLLVLVGNPEMMAALLRALPERARERAINVPGVPADATTAELKEVVDAAASTLSSRLQRALVDQVMDATRSAGRACLGREHTARALQAGAVDTLILSRAFSRAEPDVAERFVDRAFQQGATVEEVSGVAAVDLDREGGIGARLRFAA